MRGLLFIAAALLSQPSEADSLQNERLDSIVVSATRATVLTPVTHTSVGKEELRAANPSLSLPSALGLLPSVVSTTENGTGLGYTYIKIRGVSGSQINVTLNGIPLVFALEQIVIVLLGNTGGLVGRIDTRTRHQHESQDGYVKQLLHYF